jgi:hypothetical protein
MAERSGAKRWLGPAAIAIALLLGVGTLLIVRSGGGDAERPDGDDERADDGDGRDGAPDRRTSPTSGTEAPTTAAPTTTAPPEPPEVTTMATHWRPSKGLSWQWQLDGQPVDTSVEVDVYDVDLFETPADTVAELHDRGSKVICYFSAGSWEPYRPDADDYPEEVVGGAVEGWPDERWLDIRRLDLLRPLMAARMDLCADKGFDGVEPDWMDSHVQDTGFPITAADQLRFNRMLAEMAHERGLAIGLKNDLDQAAELADEFDFAVVEQCAEFGECGELAPFLDRDKPVFHAEYDLPVSAFCAESRQLGLSSIRKRVGLDPWRESC